MRINWKKFVITFSLLVLLVIAVAFIARHFSDHRKYIINDLPTDDAIYSLLTEDVSREMKAGFLELAVSEHVLFMADALKDANDVKAGKDTNPQIQVGTWEMELVRSGTMYKKGDTTLFLGPSYIHPIVTLMYTKGATSFLLLFDEREHGTKTLCITDLTDIADVNLRAEIFNDFLVQFRELLDEAKVVKTAAEPTLIRLEKKNCAVNDDGKSD